MFQSYYLQIPPEGLILGRRSVMKRKILVCILAGAVILLVMLNVRKVFSVTTKQSTVIQKGICRK